MVPRKMVTRNPSALISTSISILMFVTFTALYHDVHGYSTYYYYSYWKMNPIGGTINLSYNDPRAITIIPAAASTKKRASVRSTSSSMALLASTKEGMSEKLSDSSSGCSSSNTKTKKIRTLHPNLRAFLKRNFFLVGMAVGVTVAKMFPSWGTAGTIPELVLSKYGVFLVFLLSGLSLELQDLKASILDFRLNMLIQCFNLLVWPCLVGLPTVTVLQKFSHHLPSSIFALPKELLDGILIVSCLPTTINMCVFLSSASNANVATALCNAILGNLLGILVTPAWLLYFFGGTTQGGATIDLPFHSMVSKLCSKVLLPVSIGQMLRQITAIKHWYKSNSQYFKRASEVSTCINVYILYSLL
jgi:predicted Na+-dependent transporter